MQLLKEYEGILDTLNWNLFKSLSEIAMSVKDKDSIQAFKQQLMMELTNVNKASFPDIRSFTNHLITSGVTVVLGIKKIAKGKSKCAEAYKVGDNKIVDFPRRPGLKLMVSSVGDTRQEPLWRSGHPPAACVYHHQGPL
eukprot:162977-Rhodomonas_salina.2